MDTKDKRDKSSAYMETPNEDFVPYACHYDEHTILTKNGHLLQTIRISGFSEKVTDKKANLQELIRQAILDNIHDSKYAIWIQTVRRKNNLDPPSHYNSVFAKDIHDSWCQKNFWKDKFVNELYVTILHVGLSFDRLAKISLASFSLLKKINTDYLSTAKGELDTVVASMLKVLEVFGATRLSVKLDKAGARSELLEYFNKLINLQEARVDLPIQDLSKSLINSYINFDSNNFQVTNNKKHYASIFSIKDYQDQSLKLIENFMKLPQEFIVTQTLNFVDGNKAKESFANLDKMLKISEDEFLRRVSGLARMMDENKGGDTGFGNQQLTIMLIANDKESLEIANANTAKQFAKMGIIIVREDLNMESCYWSQLPGNFTFINRNNFISTNKMGGFASLHNSPKGRLDNPFGSAVTLFRRNDGTPYLFNFHDSNNNGNSLIIGPDSSYKRLLFNFLMTFSTKYQPKIFLIDTEKKSEITFRAIGGKYLNLQDVKINPFALEDNKKNRTFLKLFLSSASDRALNDGEMAKLEEYVNLIFSFRAEERHFDKFISIIDDEAIKLSFANWQENGKYHKFLGNDASLIEDISFSGFYAGDIIEDNVLTASLLIYIIYRFSNTLDGTVPSFVFLNDIEKIASSNVFLGGIKNWLESLATKNAVAVLMSNIKLGKVYQEIVDKIATKFFMPDKENVEIYKNDFMLSEDKINIINNMKILYRHFYIEQDNDSDILELNLDGIDYALKIFRAEEDTLKLMHEAIKETSDNPVEWLFPFYKKIEA